METVIKYNGVNLVVNYRIEGKYFTATYYDPVEYPEIHINSICVEDSDTDLQNTYNWEQIEEIEKLIEL